MTTTFRALLGLTLLPLLSRCADADAPVLQATADASVQSADTGRVRRSPSADAAAAPDAPVSNRAALTVTDVQVVQVANPHACRVRWQTNLPADSVVSFGAPVAQVRARDSKPVLAHDVLVHGLHAAKTYVLRPRSQTGDGQRAAGTEVCFTTPALPQGIEAAVVDLPVANPDPLAWYLTSLHLGQPAMGGKAGYPPAAVVYDQSGQVVWYKQMYMSQRAMAKSTPDGSRYLVLAEEKVALYELDGSTVWEWPLWDMTKPMPKGPFTGVPHHDIALLQNGNIGQLQMDLREGVYGDRLVELDSGKNIVWMWSTFDHLAPAIDDWTHGNSMQFVQDDAKVLFSARNLSTVYFIDRKSGKVDWSAGSHGSLKFHAGANGTGFALQHDATVLPNGNVLLHDNGMPQRGYSRVVEYAVDSKQGSFQEVWQYHGPKDLQWYAGGEGSAERLPNGDTLIGVPDNKAGYPAFSRVFVVDTAGKVKWQLHLAKFKESFPIVYRARLQPAYGLEAIPATEVP